MRMYDIIKKKRDGGELSAEEIRFFIEGYTAGEIPDYQAAALCMALYFQGMNLRETTDLTLAVRDSGDRLDFSSIQGVRVDKHSTGGVGDKTSLVVAPLVASLGVKVAKMSGRGLGHTGGTIDKLESIDGFSVTLSDEEFLRIVNTVGIAIVGQSRSMAPADKKLYALRDVTATVDSQPLIASSIMGKKLAADDDCIVLDVKTGSGSFMKTLEDSRSMAKIMVEIGKAAGKKIIAVISDMDRPLGCAVGNSVEVIEAIETLKGCGPEDLTELSVALASQMLVLAGKGDYDTCEKEVIAALKDGRALGTFAAMVKAQGGNEAWIRDPSLFPKAPVTGRFVAETTGYIARVDTEGYGRAALLLGAGRNTMADQPDYRAGMLLKKKTGDFVNAGDVIAELYTAEEMRLAAAAETLRAATVIGNEKPERRPLIFDIVR